MPEAVRADSEWLSRQPQRIELGIDFLRVPMGRIRIPAKMDGNLRCLHVRSRFFRDTRSESAGIAALFDELAEQVPELIARELSDGSLRVVIRTLSGAELVKLLTMLADLRESLEKQKLFCSAAMISLVQDRVRNERRARLSA